jgi:hypothetical protein
MRYWIKPGMTIFCNSNTTLFNHTFFFISYTPLATGCSFLYLKHPSNTPLSLFSIHSSSKHSKLLLIMFLLINTYRGNILEMLYSVWCHIHKTTKKCFIYDIEKDIYFLRNRCFTHELNHPRIADNVVHL